MLSADILKGLKKTVVEIFDRSPIRSQPDRIVGVSSDRELLRELHDAVRDEAIRGRCLDRYPIELSDAGLRDVSGNRTITRGALYIDICASLHSDTGEIPDLDHALTVLLAGSSAREGCDERPPGLLEALGYWQAHLRGIARKLGDSRLLTLQIHSENGEEEICNGPGRSDRPTPQYPIEAEAFIVLAARAGLFNDGPARRFPTTSAPCRASLHSLTRRDYLVRHAVVADLDRLCELEKLCWPHTRANRRRIHARLRDYPQGQFVLEKDGRVLGVVYSQRIAAVDSLDACTAKDVHRLHDPSGAVIQLLAVNIDPQFQSFGFGDQLLEFMLQRCALVAGVERVVGVTLCKSFNAGDGRSFADYIHEQGAGQDPVLAFHRAHGAEVVRPIPGYRPQDHANLGHGVLVAYDILHRIPRRQRPQTEVQADGDKGPSADSIEHLVRTQVAILLRLQEHQVDGDLPLMEMGLDSADLMQLQQRIEQQLGASLESGFFFEFSTIDKVVKGLASVLGATTDRVEEDACTAFAEPTRRADIRPSGFESRSFPDNAIAIVGMACKLPGGIETSDRLWRALADGECMIGPYPRARGPWPSGDDRAGIDLGGFVEDVDAFDGSFFRMSPAEAAITDPQQRMLMELAWSCIEDAGIVPATLKGSRMGVFVGASNADYGHLIQDSGREVDAHHGTGSSLAILANRISYFLDLSGPSLLIDTACSSSLVALHTAIRSLRSGECGAALVCGANLICHPDLSVAYHKAGMLSADGRCKTFDAGANGYVRSEGAVVLLLKPLRAAIADGDPIHAVIRGSAMNHGGMAGGLTVPNPQKQTELLTAAWSDARIDAHEIGYLEAHGTGTPLGDPIEVQAMQAAYLRSGAPVRAKTCAIGSIKSNLGHLESAAGVAGILKVVLSMQHAQLPATINFERLNPKIKLEGSPFRIQERHGEWSDAEPRVAGVSSFGSGGTNAHVVLQEYLCEERAPVSISDGLFVLSAVDEARLRAYAARVVDWLDGGVPEQRFADAIYSWQIGRTAMKHRLAIRVRSFAQLRDQLSAWLMGGKDVSDLWTGQVGAGDPGLHRAWATSAGKMLIEQAVQKRELEQLGILWVTGVEIDWTRLYGEPKPRRVRLPTYAFARERHWVDTAPMSRKGVSHAPETDSMHPLLHVNASDLSRQRYVSIFDGAEFFLSDHRVGDEACDALRILPAVVYLEMVRAAIGDALPGHADDRVLEIRDTVWIRPLVVAGPTRVVIELMADETDRIDYRIYAGPEDARILHCEGYALIGMRPPAAALDISKIQTRLNRHSDSGSLYSAFTTMGLHYGNAHRALAGVYVGAHELLARLKLPAAVGLDLARYVLHPSMTDGALQAAFGLLVDLDAPPARPMLPFALRTLRIFSPCVTDMQAWIRPASDGRSGDADIALDIDLCDAQGNICVQMHGYSPRAPGKDATFFAAHDGHVDALLATPIWVPDDVASGDASPIDDAEHHLILCELPQVDADMLAASFPRAHLLTSPAEGARTLEERYVDHALACFERIQTLLRSTLAGRALVQIVVPDHEEQVVFAGLSGLLKTAMLENPSLAAQLILVPPRISTDALAHQLRAERSRPLDVLVRHAPDGRQVARWQETSPGDNPAYSPAFRKDGVYLITGGLGGLGRLFAREILASATNATVVLTGRSPSTLIQQTLLDDLSPSPDRLSYRQMDPADPDQVRRVIAAIQTEHGRLDGILHSAGMIADNFILKKSAEEFAKVLMPKVRGTLNLDRASAHIELDFLVLFSSIASALGNLGQADYAVANGFMDQYAAYRNGEVVAGRRHGRTLSINWPLWDGGGMAVDATSLDWMERAMGLRSMSQAAGMAAFHRCMALQSSQVLVLAGDPARLRQTLLATQAIASPPPHAEPGDRLGPSPEFELEDLAVKTQDYLRHEFSGLLKLPAHKLDVQTALGTYGIDSIMAMQLTERLEQSFGPLPKTLFFEYQTIGDLAGYFVAQHAARITALLAPDRVEGKAPQAVPTLSQPRRRFVQPPSAPPSTLAKNDPIAIIGLSGRYPESDDIEAYWRNLRDGRDCIVEVPKERWDWRQYFSEDRSQDGRHFSKWGGFIAGVDEFDPLFFGISPRDAKAIDPQERLFLQHAWMAIEDAGYTRAGLQIPDGNDLPGQVGVYVGLMYTEYQLLGAAMDPREMRMGFAGIPASIANRVSHVLNLHGPSMTLDTMCSSSLTAIHLACQDLRQGRTQLAIAGGVNVSIHPNKYLMLSTGQFISSDGHCQSFGEGGDGYIPAEGVGVVVLKRLSQAQRDGDHIYGLIRGSAINHGGRTNGYTVPNLRAQAAVIARTLTEADVDARHISYLEAHGTGTKLGDPIEIAALSQAFQSDTSDTGFCLIGSAKSNIGHAESAAGIAGLTKVLLQLRHRQIVPSLHSARLNPHIDFAQTPFVVNQTLRAWDSPVVDGRSLPRIAGISSFGAGGSNAHLIVAEYEPQDALPVVHREVAVLLSARTPEQLRRKARDILAFVVERGADIDLTAMAYTLQVGREAMEERLGLIVASLEELREKLQAWIAGHPSPADCYEGQTKPNREALSLFDSDADLKQAIENWLTKRQLSKLLELWVKGLEVQWARLYGAETRMRRISLPTYPFARDRYWLDDGHRRSASQIAGPSSSSVAPLHPLLHTNESTLREHRYRSVFSGDESFLIDLVDTADPGRSPRKALSGAAYFEMARAAIRLAIPEQSETVLELRDVVWAQPIVLSETTRVDIALTMSDDDRVWFEIYSDNGEREVIHCQGHAVLLPMTPPRRLDLAQIRADADRDPHQQVTELRAHGPLEPGVGHYVLNPESVHAAMQAASALIVGGSHLAVQSLALERLRISAPCVREMLAWIRHASGSPMDGETILLDIDLCDAQGAVCAQMQGVAWRPQAPIESEAMEERRADAIAPLDVTKPAAEPSAQPALPPAASVPRRIAVFGRSSTTAQPGQPGGQSTLALPVPAAGLARPAVTLQAPAGLQRPAATRTPAARAAIALSPAVARTPEVMASVELYDCGNGIFSCRIAAPDHDNVLSPEVIDQLLIALECARREPSLKVLMLEGTAGSFLRGGRDACNAAIARGLYSAIVAFPYPVIAVARGDALGAGFLLAVLCDLMVCSEAATYGFTDPQNACYPTLAETALFAERFGPGQAQDLLYSTVIATGDHWRRKGWTCPIAPDAHVHLQANALAATLAEKPELALRLLKQHLVRPMTDRVAALAPAAMVITEPDGDANAKLASPSRRLQVSGVADGVAQIRLQDTGAKTATKALLADLGLLFGALGDDSSCRAVVLSSDLPGFLPESALSEEWIRGFRRMLADAPVPVVVALEGDVRGKAWLLAQCCEQGVYTLDGRYTAEGFGRGTIAQLASALFMHRLGGAAAREVLLTEAAYSGTSLQERVGGLIAVSQDLVLETAVELAKRWASLPRAALATWKRWSVTAIETQLQAVPAGAEVLEDVVESTTIAMPTPIALQSAVVSAIAHPDGVVLVKMEDRQAMNMFSEALIAGVTEAFAHAGSAPGCKVVVLTGYDGYFSSGGTKDNLLAIHAGRARFIDYRKIFEAARVCPLPVVAAMQGHGIGAGWTLGMFADVVLLSGESQYASPYMRYGFTPGAGATWVLADRIGHDLSREGLLTAQFATGIELQARGMRLPVMPRSDVVDTALALARDMARSGRGELIERKRRLTAYADAPVEEAYRNELALHEQTFVGQAQTLLQIERTFHERGEAATAQQETRVRTATPELRDAPGTIMDTLRSLLAHELHLRESEIDDHAQFVDLGLDSISGVTWIRKINERYGTAIEATKVYSYPTLAQLGRYVLEEAGKGSGSARIAPEAAAAAPTAPIAPIAPVANSDRLRQVEAHLKTLLAHELHLEAHEIGDHAQFAELGLDSISGVTWIRKINDHYRISIEATRIYKYSTIAQLSRHVDEESAKSGLFADSARRREASQPLVPAPMRSAQGRDAPESIAPMLMSRRARTISRPSSGGDSARMTQPIAVIGMAGQFPQARNVDEYWRNIAEGRDCITEVSPERWDVDALYRPGDPVPGKSNSKWAGALEDYDRFDPLFFNISPTEAEHMDPQQRLFLQACWQGIEDAGYNAQSLSGAKCGVFVGCAGGDYHQLSREHQLSAQGFTGSATSILAARISYHLNLLGPCISIDTACSSSLVAMAYACDSLIAGTSDLALAGGVHVMAGPDLHIKASQAGMLSAKGRCSTFDQGADGFVPGEGVGVVLLKRLADAERDRDIIHAVIEGWGVNQDGKTNGITAPNPESQTRLEQEVYDRFRIDPSGIQLVEAHGTGTKLGDPIEVEALQQAFKKYTQSQGYCALSSVKSNIGHCATAAGVAGAIKLILALKHEQLPPTINYQRLNEHIALDGSPFYVNNRLRVWEPGATGRRRAAVSSFGFSGTNAHMVLCEYRPRLEKALPVAVVTQDGKMIVPLSAKTPERLRERARDLLGFLQSTPSIDLADVAYTLQVGRQAMEERVGFLVASPQHLIERLQAYLDGAASVEDCLQGRVLQSKESMSVLLTQDEDLHDAVIEKCIASRKLSRLLDLWIKGLEFDWNRLYGEIKPRRICLPTYPFARERYWLDASARAQATEEHRAVATLHPLLHANTSDLREQRYSSTFSGDEFFLADHRVRMADAESSRVLPGVAYLEMARAAIAHAVPEHPLVGYARSPMLELRNIAWTQPLLVDVRTRIHIALSEDESDGIEFEIYSSNDGLHVAHAQGSAAFVYAEPPLRLDLDALRQRMDRAVLEPEAIYAAFDLMGLHYGPAHRPLVALFVGEHEALARLRLPPTIVHGYADYVLHPSLLDGALQASLGAIFDLDDLPGKPSLPFALDSLQVLSPCTTEMTAWVRLGSGVSPTDKVLKLEIDLCDAQGMTCAKLRGLALRTFDRDHNEAAVSEVAVPSATVDSPFDRAFYEHLVENIARHRVSVDDAVEME